MNDLRYAIRQLGKSSGFALVSVLTLALGIGANIAVFSVTNAVLLNPSGVPHAANLVALRARYNAMPDLKSIPFSAPDYQDVAEGRDIFAASGVMDDATFNFSRDNAIPELLVGAKVSAGFFDVFEARPIMGRLFAPEEDQPGAAQEVVLSYRIWRQRLGGNPGVIGQTLMLNEQPFRVVGVMGPEFNWPSAMELWVPLALPPARYHDAKYRHNENLLAVGRLQPGVTVGQANAYLDKKTQENIASEGSDGFSRASGWGMFAVPLAAFMGGDLRKPLTVLLAAVAMVLLIACANIAGLQMARASAKQRELAVRVALGASRGDIVRQALAESVVLTAAGVALGFALAFVVTPLLARGLPGGRGLPGLLGGQIEVPLGGPVVLYVSWIAIVCSLLCGVVPAWQRTQPGWFAALQESGRYGGTGRASQNARSTLVVVQIALSLLLLAGAGLLLSSLRVLERVETGFQPAGLLSARFSLPRTVYDNDQKQAAFLSAVNERLRNIPGVTSSAIIDNLPFGHDGGMASFFIHGRSAAPNDPGPHGNVRQISPGYFSTLHIPVLRGRDFSDDDRQRTQLVAIVDTVLAHQYWPGQDPVGQQIGFDDRAAGPWYTIVAVVAHARNSSLEADTQEGFYYLPLAQVPNPGGSIVVRSARSAANLQGDLAAAVRASDSSIALYDIQSMEDRVDESLGGRRFVVTLLTAFAGLALLLAALGLYGVINYSVRMRTRELGVRMALGAQRNQVLGMVVMQGLRLTAIGLAAGFVAALALGRIFSSLLFKVSVLELAPWLSAVAVLTVTVLLASYLPARRAASIEPMKALRTE